MINCNVCHKELTLQEMQPGNFHTCPGRPRPSLTNRFNLHDAYQFILQATSAAEQACIRAANPSELKEAERALEVCRTARDNF